MVVRCVLCVLSGRGLCDGLITRPEESYRLWCVLVCDFGTSRMRGLKLIKGCKCRIKKINIIIIISSSSSKNTFGNKNWFSVRTERHHICVVFDQLCLAELTSNFSLFLHPVVRNRAVSKCRVGMYVFMHVSIRWPKKIKEIFPIIIPDRCHRISELQRAPYVFQRACTNSESI
jgi:hypothetical protein